MNHLAHSSFLINRYAAMRHGPSKAKKLGLIQSNPAHGVHEYGLTSNGFLAVRSSVRRAAARGLLDKDTVIVSSDFLRARESANAAMHALGAKTFFLNELLRERWFGSYDGKSDDLYARVWTADKRRPGRAANGVESADHVQERATSLIAVLEKLFDDRTVLLISHGDILQILQTGFQKMPASRHRSFPHLEPAEIRELILAP
jgi:broad specificity phosphatase PhoE